MASSHFCRGRQDSANTVPGRTLKCFLQLLQLLLSRFLVWRQVLVLQRPETLSRAEREVSIARLC